MSATAFSGVGWQFPLALSPDGRVTRTAESGSVRQSIWTILSTSPGERVMLPNFGCGIYDQVFSPAGGATYGQLREAVVQALVAWEPRIDVIGVDVSPSPDRNEVLLISIRYLLKTTNSRFNLVYPFYAG